uniref:Sulfatase 1 n=3 Tax=Homininae TaxID=207598 RepID=A0A2I3T6H0_PANTR
MLLNCITCSWRRGSWRILTSFTPPTMVTILGSLDWSRGNPCHMTLIFVCLFLFVVQV